MSNSGHIMSVTTVQSFSPIDCQKVNNQLNVMIRFRNLICTATKLKLYNAFILPHLQYCSTVWHFCSARNRDKLESLNKRAHTCF